MDENGDLIGRVRLPKGHDGGESTIELRFEHATRLIVRLNDSAAIDDLVFSIESQIAALAKAGPDVV